MQGQGIRWLIWPLLLILLIPDSSALNISPSEVDDWIEVEGGWSVIVEEHTAVWCSSCVLIDPYLRQAQESHGSRMILIGLHPDDGIDPFGNEYSEQRLSRFEEKTGTPAFFVDGDFVTEGIDVWPDVQSAVLKAESEATDYRPMTLSIVEINGSVHWDVKAEIGTNESLNILVLAHGLAVPSGVENPGGKTRDNVLIYSTNNSNGSYLLPLNIEGYSIVATVQSSDSNTLGAVEARVLPLSESNDERGLWALMILLCLGAILVWPRKLDAVSQEEE